MGVVREVRSVKCVWQTGAHRGRCCDTFAIDTPNSFSASSNIPLSTFGRALGCQQDTSYRPMFAEKTRRVRGSTTAWQSTFGSGRNGFISSSFTEYFCSRPAAHL